MFNEFKKFIARGNVMDLAIGIIIGGAFQKIVTSLVNDIITPSVSILTGKIDFSHLYFTIGSATINFGNFITAIIDFLITAITIFIMVRYLNRMNEKLQDISNYTIDKNSKKLVKKEKNEPVEEPTTKTCPFCYSEINLNATRCPSCTSILEEKEEK